MLVSKARLGSLPNFNRHQCSSALKLLYGRTTLERMMWRYDDHWTIGYVFVKYLPFNLINIILLILLKPFNKNIFKNQRPLIYLFIYKPTTWNCSWAVVSSSDPVWCPAVRSCTLCTASGNPFSWIGHCGELCRRARSPCSRRSRLGSWADWTRSAPSPRPLCRRGI